MPGHRCKRQQLFLLDATNLNEKYKVGDGQEQEATKEWVPEAEPMVSLHALDGAMSHDTMCIKGFIKSKEIVILIDSGSTHNFLDANIPKRVGVLIQPSQPISVAVADGGHLISRAMCKQLHWTMQGTPFETDVRFLPLGGCDLVLGIQWLATLGPIVWDFARLRMEFNPNGVKHVLRGKQTSSTQAVTSSLMSRLISKRANGMVARLNMMEVAPMPNETPSDLVAILKRFADIFQEPHGLPPIRSHDHRIHLDQPGSEPTNVCPYRYPYVQKNKIEKLVRDMLTSGLIRPSVSPFSSQIIG